MTLHIKNMVCDRCILVVQQELEKVTEIPFSLTLGEVVLKKDLPDEFLTTLRTRLLTLGFELLTDKKSSTVEKIKNTIIQLIHRSGDQYMDKKLSVLLEEALQMDYHYLSGLFSDAEGTTIEKYAILQRIEKAKELLTYNELTINEIAERSGYSSVQHLSQQFKKITGLTPSAFRQDKKKTRTPLDKL